MVKDRVWIRQVIVVGLILIGVCRLWAMDPETTARRAWNEFSFQSFDNAQRLFMDLEQVAAATPAQRQEALIGLAMVAQFDERRPNLVRAEALYRRALADESLTGQPRVLAEAMLAETLAMAGRLAEADALWDSLIRQHPTSLIAQDALIRRTVAHLTTFAAPETAAALAYCAARAAEMPAATPDNPGMAMPRERLLAWLHLGRKEYAAARAALMRLTDLALRETISQGSLAIALIQIARLSEMELDDPATAGHYYRRLVEETPNDVRSYFALTRAIAYGAFAADEVRALRIPGLTEEILAELFAARDEEAAHGPPPE